MLLAGVTAAVAMLVVGVFAIISLSTDVVARHSLGSYQHSHTFSHSVAPGKPLNIAECVHAVSTHGGTCGANLTGVGEAAIVDGRALGKELRVTEGPWGHGFMSGEYELLDGRWPTAPGEAVVGPDLAGARVITTWGGRTQFTVVGTSRSVFSRGGSFVLAAPGSFSRVAGVAMELSGVSADVTVYFDDHRTGVVAAAASALGIDPAGLQRSRDSVVREAYEWRGQVAILLPGIALATAGGIISGLALGGWSDRLKLSLYRQGIPRSVSGRWVLVAHLISLLACVPMGAALGWAFAWGAKPALERATGSVQSSPSIPLWATALFVVIICCSALASAGGRVRRPEHDSARGSLRRGVALVAAVLAVWVGPLLGLDQVRAELAGGAMLSISVGLLAVDALRVLSARSGTTLAREYSRRVFRQTLPRLGARLAVVVIAVGIMGSVVASLASSNLATNRRYGEGRATPEHAAVVYSFDERVAKLVNSWASKAAVSAHPIWFVGSATGPEVAVVADLAGAAAALGRELSPDEGAALRANKVLAVQSTVQVRNGQSVSDLPSVPLAQPGGYLMRVAGLMTRAAADHHGMQVPTTAQHSLFTGVGDYTTRIHDAAVELGIGMTWYVFPAVPDVYTGGLVDQAQPWILGFLSIMVMGSLGTTIAEHVRSRRSALRAIGLRDSTGRRLLVAPITAVVVAVVALGTLPPLVVLGMSLLRGADVIVPWEVLLRNCIIVATGSAIGALLGSLRVSIKERFQ